MIKKFVIAIAGFILVLAVLGGVKAMQIQKASSQPHVTPASSVTTVEAVEATWRQTRSAIGTLAPVQGVTLGADADGTIARISVENGAAVREGDLLLEFDTTVEHAQLASAEARLAIAKLNRDRASELRERNTNSQAELDQVEAQLKQARADADALCAQLAKKQVRAPFAGRVGIRLVNVGQFVSRGAPLMPIQKLDRVYADFTIPQRQLPELALGQPVKIHVDAFPGRTFSGEITAINPVVDASSRNVSVQATLANPDELLRAGMFARVEV